MSTFRKVLGGAVVLVIVSHVLGGFSSTTSPASPSSAGAAESIAEASPTAPTTQKVAYTPTKPYINEVERADILKQATKHLKRTRDKIEKVTFYGPPGVTSINTSVTAYIGVEDGGAPYLRMKVGYVGDRWIFFNRIKIMADEEIVLEKSFHRSQIIRDNAAGAVWEIADYPAGASELTVLETISRAKSVTIRYSGRDRIHDHKMGAKEKAGLRTVLTAYEDLNNKL